MKLYRLFTVTAAAVALTSTASAQGKSASAPKAPHVTTSAPKAGGTTTHGPKAGTSAGASQASTKKPASTTASASHGKSGKHASSSTTEGTSTTSTGTTATADAPPPNHVALKISNNPAQLAKIQPQLDALGLTLDEATKGFRNQGQFIAALNASTNRGIDFVALQEAMTVEGLSLGQAAKKIQNTPPEPEPETTPAPTSTPTGTTGQ
jgi:predicted component of type VI protein secretion system